MNPYYSMKSLNITRAKRSAMIYQTCLNRSSQDSEAGMFLKRVWVSKQMQTKYINEALFTIRAVWIHMHSSFGMHFLKIKSCKINPMSIFISSIHFASPLEEIVLLMWLLQTKVNSKMLSSLTYQHMVSLSETTDSFKNLLHILICQNEGY